jgi:2'-5' RNA ligase
MALSKRLFAAIKIIPDSHFISVFEEMKQRLRHEKIKWVETNNLHLTLKFFGETPLERIPRITTALGNAVNRSSSFQMKVEKTGIFGSRYDPKLVWAGISDVDPLIGLEKDIMKQLMKIGFRENRGNFVPHLTLGRIKNLQDKKLFQNIIADFWEESYQEIVVEKLYLFDSILQKTGPVYSVVKEFQLKSNRK